MKLSRLFAAMTLAPIHQELESVNVRLGVIAEKLIEHLDQERQSFAKIDDRLAVIEQRLGIVNHERT